MKTATVRDLRYDFPKIEAWLAGGEDILITKHSKPIARLCADLSTSRPMPPHPDYEARRKKPGVTAFSRMKKSRKCGLLKRVSHDFSLSRSNQRTAHGGHRTLDIFHVATAMHLRATHFLTFDNRQRDLARHAGLEVPL